MWNKTGLNKTKKNRISKADQTTAEKEEKLDFSAPSDTMEHRENKEMLPNKGDFNDETKSSFASSALSWVSSVFQSISPQATLNSSSKPCFLY